MSVPVESAPQPYFRLYLMGPYTKREMTNVPIDLANLHDGNCDIFLGFLAS